MRRDSELVSHVATAIVGTFLALVVFAAVAPRSWLSSADALPGCFVPRVTDDDYAYMVRQETLGAGPNSAIQVINSGIRASVFVTAGDNCLKINSVYVWSADGLTIFEFGWMQGKFSCTSDPGTFQQFDRPTLFAVGRQPGPGSQQLCRTFNNYHPKPGRLHKMQASDADENTYFGAWYHGDMILGGPTAWDTDMTEGQIGINMERANPNDNAFSKFFNIEEVINNDWTPVDFMGWREDRDPDYVFDISAPDRHRFIHN